MPGSSPSYRRGSIAAAAMNADPLTRHITYSQIDLRREYPVPGA